MRAALVAAGLLAAAVATAAFLPPWLLSLALFALARGIAVLGLLALMRGGLVSFGQALFLALGGYAAATLSLGFGITDAFLRVGAGAVAAGVAGLVLGLLLRRYRGIFFAMLSLAFSMLVYGLLVKSETLGGSDGIRLPPSTFAGWSPRGDEARAALFMLAACLAGAAAFGMRHYLRSTLGRQVAVLAGNELRVEYLGGSVPLAVHVTYVIAAALAGIGGTLSAMTVGHVDPDMAVWTTSGELVFVAILGGAGSVAAPFVGSLAFEAVHAAAHAYAPQAWRIILGGSLLAAILLLPGGLTSLRLRRPAQRDA